MGHDRRPDNGKFTPIIPPIPGKPNGIEPILRILLAAFNVDVGQLCALVAICCYIKKKR